MAFTVHGFPNIVFESLEQFNKYKETRGKIRARLKGKTKDTTKVVKTVSTVKHNDPRLEYLKQLIAYYLEKELNCAQRRRMD